MPVTIALIETERQGRWIVVPSVGSGIIGASEYSFADEVAARVWAKEQGFCVSAVWRLPTPLPVVPPVRRDVPAVAVNGHQPPRPVANGQHQHQHRQPVANGKGSK